MRLTLVRLSGRPLFEMSRQVVFGPFQSSQSRCSSMSEGVQRDVAVGVEFADRDA
jgi:hypothetical protein